VFLDSILTSDYFGSGRGETRKKKSFAFIIEGVKKKKNIYSF